MGMVEEKEEKEREDLLKWEKKKKKKNGGRCCKLFKYEELPDYMKDNEYIRDYYRAEWPVKDTVLSIFSWHNETLNIWTHFVGFLIFLALTIISINEKPPFWELAPPFSRSVPGTFGVNNTSRLLPLVLAEVHEGITTTTTIVHGGFARKGGVEVEKWPWLVYLIGATLCLLCSTLSHLLACISNKFNLFFWRLDYAGISLMIVSSFFPAIYYVFLCQPFWQYLYLSSIAALGILTAVTLLTPAFSASEFRPFRAILFLAMGFSGLIPAAHALWLFWDEQYCLVTLAYEVAMAIFYATGAGFYVSRVPERWKPGAFDLCGHSHQIFHLLVIAGALAHYAANIVLIEWRQHVTCPAIGL